MKVLIAGGSGFLGTGLSKALIEHGHEIFTLTRRAPLGTNQVQWDGKTTSGWGHLVNEMDAVVHLTGYGLEHWPWTQGRKQKFIDSRVLPGRALVAAVREASHRPGVFLQTSGINRYGLRGETSDESTPPADDFLAQITVEWENATQPVEELGVRRVVTRNAVVLSQRRGQFPLMVLPVRLFLGGKFGTGTQAMNWIHRTDYANAARFLLENQRAQGPYNLIAPKPVSNAEFMRAVAQTLRRPYWFHAPAWLLRLVLGEMSVLLTEGRPARPTRLIELGFQFKYGELESAMRDLLK